MKKFKINERLECMIAELETGKTSRLDAPAPAPLMDARRRSMLDWRSFPPDHPFYQEGAALEGTIAAAMSKMYDAASFNDDVRIFGAPNPSELEFLERVQ